MTKWVTILLLTLAVLVFGVSRMRPTPSPPAASPQARATAEATASPESTAEAVDTTHSEAAPAATQGTKAPKFSSGQSQASKQAPAQKGQTSAVKSDPFNRSAKKKPKPISGRVKAATLSDSAGGLSQTLFPADTGDIYVTVTPAGIRDEVELTATFRSVMTEEDKFSSPIPSSGPPRRRLFRLSRPKEGWMSGPYQVAFHPKGSSQIVGLARFEIAKADEKIPQGWPEPEYLDLVADLESDAQSSFPSNLSEILLRVSAQELPTGKTIRTVWSAVEVDRLTAGELVAVAAQSSPRKGQDAVFTFEAPPGGFHPGSYKVDVYFEQELKGTQAFFLQPPSRK